MTKPLALIIDDEPDIRELLAITLKRMNLDCAAAENLQQARALLAQNSFNICLTDMRLPDGDGVEFVAYAQEHYPAMPIAVITAHGSMETAIQALKSGAYDFLTKPVDLISLRTLITGALKLSAERLPAAQEPGRQRLIGSSRTMQQIRLSIAKLSRSQAPIYISGESGTGKELVARMIHEQGPRAEMPFVPVNCGAIPQELMESEFFGHVKGSFTGAVSNKDGLFAAASGGTLFFDEIAELPQHMQVKLLRVIQEKAFRKVGATQEEATDVRILSATHSNLAELVRQGRFRQDLFYRVNVIELHIPSLRERREDIPLLVDHILQKISSAGGQDIRLDDAALAALSGYSFPGNIRELENILERAMTLCDNNRITVNDLQLPEEAAGEQAVADNPKPGQIRDVAGLDTYLGDIERQTILEALEKNRWNKTRTAKQLGITLRALRYRLEKLGLE